MSDFFGFLSFFVAVFVAAILYIIQSVRCCVNRRLTRGVVGRLRGGVVYRKIRVLAGSVDKQGLAGVDIEQGGGANSNAVAESAAGACLMIGLARDAESGGAFGGAVVNGVEGNKKGLHGAGSPVNRARLRVQYPHVYQRVVVNALDKGQLILAINPRAGG